MKVICNKDTKKIIKGLVYNVSVLMNSPSDKYKYIYLDGVGRYSIHNFKMLDGTDIPQISWRKPNNIFEKFDASTLKVGDIIVCKSDRYKSLQKNGKYKISHINKVEYLNWSKQKAYYINAKFEGYNRFIKLNQWSFRNLGKDESREIALGSVFGEKQNFTVDKNLRKIDVNPNIEKILVESLSKSILDKNRHHLDIIDWACKKSCKELGMTRDDFKNILNKPLKEILEIIETNKN